MSTQPFKPLETAARCSLGLWFCNSSELAFIQSPDGRREFHVPGTVLCTGAEASADVIIIKKDSLQGHGHLWSHLSLSVFFWNSDPGNASDHGDKDP